MIHRVKIETGYENMFGFIDYKIHKIIESEAPHARRTARKEARSFTKDNPKFTALITTWNNELNRWVNTEAFRHGYEIDLF